RASGAIPPSPPGPGYRLGGRLVGRAVVGPPTVGGRVLGGIGPLTGGTGGIGGITDAPGPPGPTGRGIIPGGAPGGSIIIPGGGPIIIPGGGAFIAGDDRFSRSMFPSRMIARIDPRRCASAIGSAPGSSRVETISSAPATVAKSANSRSGR